MKNLICLILIFKTSMAIAGGRAGNGGDLLLPRISESRTGVIAAIKKIESPALIMGTTNENLVIYYLDHRVEWLNKLGQFNVVAVDEEIIIDGQQKLARAEADGETVTFSRSYFEAFKPSTRELMINIIHETGHLFGEPDHQLLDEVGAMVVESFYKAMTRMDAANIIETHKQLETKEEIIDDMALRFAAVRAQLSANQDQATLAKYDEAANAFLDKLKKSNKKQILAFEKKFFNFNMQCLKGYNNYVFGISREMHYYLKHFGDPFNPGIWALYFVFGLSDTVALPFEIIGTAGNCIFKK